MSEDMKYNKIEIDTSSIIVLPSVAINLLDKFEVGGVIVLPIEFYYWK